MMAKGIVIGGTLIECSEDICRACSRAVWRARYHARQNGGRAAAELRRGNAKGYAPAGRVSYRGTHGLSVRAPGTAA